MNVVEMKSSDEKSYWEGYYAQSPTHQRLRLPSQFASFCANELHQSSISQIVDLGCGNGRDSMFFAQTGFSVISIDQSENAIEHLGSFGFENLTAVAQSALSPFNDVVGQTFDVEQPMAIYARFFLHALTDSEIDAFFSNCAQMTKTDDLVMVEYRNTDDATKPKETAAHYRNYLDPKVIAGLASKYGMRRVYETAGVGFAKYRSDDANVSRQIFAREAK